MDNGKTIKNYSAEDIRKYHAGEMTPVERHAIEKAALDDPFLADALEGYSYSKNTSAELSDLRHKFDQRTQSAKIIPLSVSGLRSNYNWLKLAVMLIIVVGAGLLMYQFAFNKSGDQFAVKQNAPATLEEKLSDSISTNQVSIDSSTKFELNTTAKTTTQNGLGSAIPKKVNEPDAFLATDSGNNLDAIATVREQQAEKKEQVAPASEIAKLPNEPSVKLSQRNDNSYSMARKQSEPRENFFRGRVVDANNNPVPFASIINRRDNAGTYSDAKGDFNLISPDSVLEVQVRSVGYENNYAQLRNNLTSNQVIMRDDNRGLNQVVVANSRVNSTERAKKVNTSLEEPEPADGWENYDTYLVNNLNVPEEVRSKEAGGEVQLSFEVNKNGEPVNIRVEKSLCSTCDQEAIRLLKEGPKWKRKNKRSRTTVKVPF